METPDHDMGSELDNHPFIVILTGLVYLTVGLALAVALWGVPTWPL